MQSEQARIVGLASAFVAAHLEGRVEDLDPILDGFGGTPPKIMDQFIQSLILLGAAALDVLLKFSPEIPADQTLSSILTEPQIFVPGGQHVPDVASAIVLQVQIDKEFPDVLEPEVDIPSLINSLLSVDVALMEAIAGASQDGKTAADWSRVFTLGSATETSL